VLRKIFEPKKEEASEQFRVLNIKEFWLRAGQSRFYGSISGEGWEFFSSQSRPEWSWGPSSLLSNG